MRSTDPRYDVTVLGGGLAGLTLALQLKRRRPDLDVLVLERRNAPAPTATHKVGESSVEIGAHYFEHVLGLGEHLHQHQLRKFGFRFFFSEGRRDIDQVTEIGAGRHLSVPSYQIDRGIFENFLVAEAERRGVRVLDGARVTRLELAASDRPDQPHRIGYERQGQAHTADAHWVVDACGRAGLLKRKLGLTESNDHACHAVWFRIQDRIALDRWSANPAWQARCEPPARWLSTNHLVGRGYWVWLIPLSSGSHSVGIVADPALHPLERMDTFDKAMDWLAQHQPLLFDELDGKRDRLQDFAFLRRFSHGCQQVFSADRWAITGEAGLFLDPFYSPGSDFIAIGNTYITELVARERQGERIGARAQVFDQTLHSFYDSTLALYTGQYDLFGDPQVLPVKVLWDYTYYWGVLAQLFFHDRLTDLTTLAQLRDELRLGQALNREVQSLLRRWSALGPKDNPPVIWDQAQVPWFAELNRSLTDRLDADGFVQRIRQSGELLCALARDVAARALAQCPGLDVSVVRNLAGPPAANRPLGALLAHSPTWPCAPHPASPTALPLAPSTTALPA